MRKKGRLSSMQTGIGETILNVIFIFCLHSSMMLAAFDSAVKLSKAFVIYLHETDSLLHEKIYTKIFCLLAGLEAKFGSEISQEAKRWV